MENDKIVDDWSNFVKSLFMIVVGLTLVVTYGFVVWICLPILTFDTNLMLGDGIIIFVVAITFLIVCAILLLVMGFMLISVGLSHIDSERRIECHQNTKES